MSAPRLVIFDCDGTLVDSQHIIVEAMGRAFDAYGIGRLPRERVLSIVGLSLPIAVHRLLPEARPQDIHAVAEAYKAAFGELRRMPEHQEPLYPGCLDVLSALVADPGVVLGIATGKSQRGVKTIIERFDLHGHFVTIQTADENPSKPHPAMVERAIIEAGSAPGRTVMVGDTTFDMEMARAAGVGAVGVSWGYHPAEELTEAGAHELVHGYGELLPALNRVFLKLADAATE